jgi:hypothetical protein
MKKYVINNDIQAMEKNIEIYKKLIEEKEPENIKKEFINSLHERYPETYSTDPNQWFYKTGEKAGQEYPMKVHYDNNNFQIMVKNTVTYKKEIEEINAKKLEDAKRLKEEEDARKEQEIEALKALVTQKEIEKQELLAQKEEELLEKSFIKNLAIDELRENLDLKDDENDILKELISDLSFIDTSCQVGGNEIGSQVNEVEIDLAGCVVGQHSSHWS